MLRRPEPFLESSGGCKFVVDVFIVHTLVTSTATIANPTAVGAAARLGTTDIVYWPLPECTLAQITNGTFLLVSLRTSSATSFVHRILWLHRQLCQTISFPAFQTLRRVMPALLATVCEISIVSCGLATPTSLHAVDCFSTVARLGIDLEGCVTVKRGRRSVRSVTPQRTIHKNQMRVEPWQAGRQAGRRQRAPIGILSESYASVLDKSRPSWASRSLRSDPKPGLGHRAVLRWQTRRCYDCPRWWIPSAPIG